MQYLNLRNHVARNTPLEDSTSFLREVFADYGKKMKCQICVGKQDCCVLL